MNYDFANIEAKWHKYWQEHDLQLVVTWSEL